MVENNSKLAVKVAFKDANEVKKALIYNNILDHSRKLTKEKDGIIFPINSKDQLQNLENLPFEVIEANLEIKKEKKNFSDLLNEFLTKEELEKVKTAYDTVGNIAVLEIDACLRNKEKQIAKSLLESNSNIETVVRKDGAHSGTFRTQDMKYLAGKETKIAHHKENGIELDMNIEEVYFSARLSTERKRISNDIKEGENVLVMFSGCAPYPNVLAKNSKAKYVYGIEINPEGYRFGVKNLYKNKLHNVFLMNGDVSKVIPNMAQEYLGVKTNSNDESVKNRLKLNPTIIEFHTFLEDFTNEEKFKHLKSKIKELKELGKQVVVHQPLDLDKKELDMIHYNIKHPVFAKFVSLFDEFDIEGVIHFSLDGKTASEENKDQVVKNIKSFVKYYDKIYFENSVDFVAKKEDIISLTKLSGLKNICIDVCHLLYLYKEEEIVSVVKEIQKHANTYFHISDHRTKEEHGGKISQDTKDRWLYNLMPLITKGILEVRSEDEANPEALYESWENIKDCKKYFDRILMPLPKSAEDFLDDALAAAKDGTILNFYDFLHEEKFFEAHDKIKFACEKNGFKYEILDTVKCGQHSPHVYRICVDVLLKKK